MTTRILLPAGLVAALCLTASAADLSVSFNALSGRVGAARADMGALQAAARPRRAVSHADSLPESCLNLPVVYIRDGDIYKNDELLGRRASSYKANCDGLVAWQDGWGDLYQEERRVAGRVAEYDVAWYGDIIVWMDSWGSLHRNGEEFRVQTHTFVKYTGDVVWKDSYGDLYRNREKFGRCENYAVAGRTADVAWVDSYGVLHRNGQELGRAQSWILSDRTGAVGWLDSSLNLYKNESKVGSDVDNFTMREDGKLIWRDRSGRYHSA